MIIKHRNCPFARWALVANAINRDNGILNRKSDLRKDSLN